MSEGQIPTAAGGILYDDSLVVKPVDAIFTREYWADRGAAATGGRGSVLFIREGTRRWVLRHYLRGGFIARWITDAYLWLGEERTRSFQEWRLLSLLHDEGLPVPAPVAARYRRSGFLYRADLITAEIPDSDTLANRITGAALPLAAWQEIGRVIARLHHRGVHHVDLNAHNVLLGADERVHVIDFDRARIRTPGPWEQRVLARLKRSLEKVKGQRQGVKFGEAEWGAVREGYSGSGQRTADSGQG